MLALNLTAQYVLIILFSQMHCQDYSYSYWYDYHLSMMQEWGLNTAAVCIDGTTYRTQLLSELKKYNIDVLEITYDKIDATQYGGTADMSIAGVAVPTQHRGFVRYSGEETSIQASHESLHLALYDAGYPKSCYVDAVHAHQLEYKRTAEDILVVEYFDC